MLRRDKVSWSPVSPTVARVQRAEKYKSLNCILIFPVCTLILYNINTFFFCFPLFMEVVLSGGRKTVYRLQHVFSSAHGSGQRLT